MGMGPLFPTFVLGAISSFRGRMERTKNYLSHSLCPAVPNTVSRMIRFIGEWIPGSMDGRLMDDIQSESYPEGTCGPNNSFHSI
jgi:hypothetical protein